MRQNNQICEYYLSKESISSHRQYLDENQSKSQTWNDAFHKLEIRKRFQVAHHYLNSIFVPEYDIV